MLPPEGGGGASSWGGCFLRGVLPLGGCASSRRRGCFLPGGVPGGDPPGTPTAAGSMHPTGMHSCILYCCS